MKRTFLLLTLLLVALIAALWLYVPGRVTKAIQQAIDKAPGIDIKQLKYQFWTNTLTLDSLSIRQGNDSKSVATIQRTRVNGLDRWKYFKTGELAVDDVILEGGHIIYSIDRDSVPNRDRQLPPWYIDFITLRQCDITIMRQGEVIAHAERVQARSHHLSDTMSGLPFIDQFMMAENIELPLPGDTHTLTMKSCSYTPSSQLIEARAVHYASDIPESQWYKSLDKKETRLDVHVPHLAMDGFDLQALIDQDQVEARIVRLSNPIINVFEDQRFNHCHTCTKPLPHTMLTQATQRIAIDSLQLLKGAITYRVRERNHTTPSQLDFSELYVSAYHITNIDPEAHMLVDAQCRLFDETPLTVHFDFPTSGKRGAYTYTGSGGAFDLTHLNDFASTVEGVSINRGVSQGINFNIKADAYGSQGVVNFRYTDLRVAFDEKDKLGSQLLSVLVNEIAIRKNNQQGANFKRGIVKTSRDRSRSIFNNLSESIQSGIRSTVMNDNLKLNSKKKRRKRRRR